MEKDATPPDFEAAALTADDDPAAPPDAGVEVRRPAALAAPVVFSSPHSGRRYPAAFVDASRLEPQALRRSEDSFVDEIFAAAPEFGAPLVRALFPRAYVDANREAFELDPEMFADDLPDYVRTRSPRIAAGLGTVPRVVANGAAIYDRPLPFAEARARIDAHHRPYHRALSELLEDARRAFGASLVVDCHSMPSANAPGVRTRGIRGVDIVLGDSHGAACAPEVTALAETVLRDAGYRVVRNRPYAGGYITRRYGRPEAGQHALQIEINRALYMDERRIQRGPGMPTVIRNMNRLVKALTGLEPALLTPAAGHLPKAAE
ncbi:MAG: N-formylglutamate amidohydrolase [Rhodospirillaceae bacterium]